MKPNLQRTWLCVAAAALLIPLAGCNKDSRGVIYAAPGENPSAYRGVTLTHGSINAALVVSDPVVTRSSDGRMEVNVPVRSRSDEELFLEYKVIWYDGVGRTVPPEMNWRPLRLERRQPANVSFAATSTEATDYNMQIRWSRP